MNDRALPLESRKMRAFSSYMWWLSTGIPDGAKLVGAGTSRITEPSRARQDLLCACNMMLDEKWSKCDSQRSDSVRRFESLAVAMNELELKLSRQGSVGMLAPELAVHRRPVRLGEAPMTLPVAVLSLSGSSFETLNGRRLPGIGGLPARRVRGGTWYDRTLRRSAAGRCFLAKARDCRPSRRSSPLTRLGSLQSPRARNIGPGKVSGRGSGDRPDRP